MVKLGETVRINGEEYQAVGDADFYRTHGESSTQFKLSGLQRVSDGARFYLTALDSVSKEHEILAEVPGLVPAQADWVASGDVNEWRVTGDPFKSMADGQYRVQRSRGTRAETTAGVSPPLAGSRTLLTVYSATDANLPPVYLYGRDVLKGSGDQEYYTENTPAAALSLKEIARVKATPQVFRWLGYLLALSVAALVLLDMKAKVHPTFEVVKLYWYLGLGSIVMLFLRKRYPFRITFYMIATAFLLYFQTLLFEYLLGVTQTTSAWNVEGFRIAGFIVLLVVLDVVHPKTFGMIAHAALIGGLISLFLYSCGFAIYACNGNPWSSYRQHVGGGPQGYIWLLVFVGFLLHRIRDYRLVPVKLEGALALHSKMEKGLVGTLAVIQKRAAALSHMADDFSDSLMVSNDTRLSAASEAYPRYQALSALMKALSQTEVKNVADHELAEQDLATLRQDLSAMRESLGRDAPETKFPGIRLSPHILAATRNSKRKV